jgi:hypothetical protein
MMRWRHCRSVALVTPMLALAACLTSNVLVTVRPDGSGTVEQTTTIRPVALVEFERLLSPEMADRKDPAVLAAELQKQLSDARGGPALRPTSVRPLKAVDAVGSIVSYEFDDVTALNLDLLPRVQGRGFWGISSNDPAASTNLRLSLEPIADGLERLTVRFPRFAMDPSAEPPSAWASGSAAEMAALKSILSGSRVTIVIRTEAPLLRTNSPFRDGNRVTLVDADIAQALFSKQIGMLAAAPGSFDELLSWAADLPGVRLAHEHDVTLDFQNPSTEPPPGGRPVAAPLLPPAADTEIFLATLSGSGGTLAVGPPTNISNSAGYDNQPSFSPDGRQIFFASARTAAGQPAPIPLTDIYRYEIATRRMWRITQTPESEFSPAMMPDGRHLSMVRVEADGTQRLCSVEPAGTPKRETAVILPNVKPVGYFAWVDERRVALYVLGERGQAATLQIAGIQNGESRTVATAIGRSLQRMPSGSISFVQREVAPDGGVTAMVKALEVASLETRPLVRPAGGMTDPYVAWLPDGTMLTASGSTIYRWRSGEPDWSAIAHLDAFGLREVSRIAVSPKGDRLAIVAQK